MKTLKTILNGWRGFAMECRIKLFGMLNHEKEEEL